MDLEKLQKLNYGAFGIHLASAIGLIITFSIIRKKVNFDSNLWSYKVVSMSDDNRDVDLEAYTYLEVDTIALETILTLIFLITAGFHLYYATDKNYVSEIKKGYNRYRWVEYSITSTLMIFILSIISGVKDFDAVLSLCALNATLMAFGYYYEISKENQAKYTALIIGFLMLIFIWYIIFRNFAYRVDEVNNNTQETVPDWVYGVLIPMFFWWISFGVVAAMNYYKGGKFIKYETYYIILSYLSKAFMGYYLAYAILRETN